MKYLFYIVVLIFSANVAFGVDGKASISGVVKDANGEPLPGASVALKNTPYQTTTDADGTYRLTDVPHGTFTIVAFSFGKKTIQQTIKIAGNIDLAFTLEDLNDVLNEVVVTGQHDATPDSRLNAVENFGIYEGKKTEVIAFSNLTVNTATNNARQIYSRVTGLNIWESDGAGLQLGIGGRGLSPNRTANFNTRQNGYDISADALGYPESYYTPPAEALEKIEIVRGAASLQYGTQFGGLLNFKFKKGPLDKKFEFTTRQSVGSWGFFGSFNSVGGTVAKGKVTYYGYYNYKQGNGYRPNSDFDFNNIYASVDYRVNSALTLNVDVTRMNYVAHQPGGLTDAQFKKDPTISMRERNWFKVDWTLLAVNFTYKFSHLTELNVRNFGLSADRNALGILEKTNVADMGGNRNLISGTFENFGNETRLLHRYNAFGQQHALVTGFRLYRGTTTAKQGDANSGSGPDFYFLNPEDVEYMNYVYPNINYSYFIENIFDITPRLSITPGLRFEYIDTKSEGYYKERTYDLAGNLVAEQKIEDNRQKKRHFLIGGIGVSFKATKQLEVYGNISQNYRAINFSDLRIKNPSLVPNLNLEDESGFTTDLGIRGSLSSPFRYEVTAFYINYDNKIGNREGNDPVTGNEYRVRENVGQAKIIGVESFLEFDATEFVNLGTSSALTLFVNSSFIYGKYTSGKPDVVNNLVEMVPPVMVRTGLTYRYKNLSSSLQFSHTGAHYSDATNAEWTSTAIEGKIPAYQVMDLSAAYTWKILKLEASCNNVLDQAYFTRRADAYPGPGIIPADGRGFYVTLQARIGK
jgi:Fe(3+) dicitrate transport protein